MSTALTVRDAKKAVSHGTNTRSNPVVATVEVATELGIDAGEAYALLDESVHLNKQAVETENGDITHVWWQ